MGCKGSKSKKYSLEENYSELCDTTDILEKKNISCQETALFEYDAIIKFCKNKDLIGCSVILLLTEDDFTIKFKNRKNLKIPYKNIICWYTGKDTFIIWKTDKVTKYTFQVEDGTIIGNKLKEICTDLVNYYRNL